MPRCSMCSTLSLQTLLETFPNGYKHHASSVRLIQSAETCGLCALILESLQEELVRKGLNSFGQLYLWSHGSRKSGTINLRTSNPNIYLHSVFKVCSWTMTDKLRESLEDRFNFKVWKPLKNPLEFVKTCVKKCEMEHGSLCWGSNSQRPSTPQVLPTRIIDVRGQGDTVRLIETKTSASRETPLTGQYCALSHAWGPSDSETLPAITTKENLAQRCQGILIIDLSKTFQEAIEITRSLGIDYLWIDSLCILQDKDDLTEWQHEAKKMKSVYKNSYLTIAATGAKDGSQGCLFSSEREGHVSMPLWKGQSGDSPLFLRKSVPQNNIDDWCLGPLQDRAWITQEWILSTRLLHCCRTELIWKCKKEEISESGISYHLNEHALVPGYEWRRIVSHYTHRSLSKITDRLVAMQGIFDEMAEQFNIDCAFGISMSDPHEDLVWYIEEKQGRPQELADLGIPSWSWGSVVGGIDHYNECMSDMNFSGVKIEFSSQTSKDLVAHCHHPFPLEQSLSSLSENSWYVDLDEDLEDQLVEDPMVFILPLVAQTVGYDIGPVEYKSLLLSMVEPATSDAPAIFRRIGVSFRWKGQAFVKSQDDHKGHSTHIIIR